MFEFSEVIFSQNYRIFEVGSDLWRSSCATYLLMQSHLEVVAKDHVQIAFEYLQGWRLHNKSGQPTLNQHIIITIVY